MDLIVSISKNNTATFICPECGKAKVADVSKYAGTDQKVTVKCKCSCGHTFQCLLGKRKQFRKTVDLPGRFTLMGDSEPVDTGLVTVVDLSPGGLKLKMNAPRAFPIGAKLLVEFNLDNPDQSPMKKKVIVRNVSGVYVGASFLFNELNDPILGFYLIP